MFPVALAFMVIIFQNFCN